LERTMDLEPEWHKLNIYNIWTLIALHYGFISDLITTIEEAIFFQNI